MKPKTSVAPVDAPHAAAKAASHPGPAAPMAAIDAGLQHQLEALNRGCCAFLEGSQRMRKVQLDAAHEALLRHQACREKLRACSNVTEALEVSREAGNADMEAASRYWNDLVGIGNTTLAELAELQGSQLGLVRAQEGSHDADHFKFASLTAWNPLAHWITLIAPPLP